MSLNLNSLHVYGVLANLLDRAPVQVARMIVRRLKKSAPAITKNFNIDKLTRSDISKIAHWCREYHELALLLG